MAAKSDYLATAVLNAALRNIPLQVGAQFISAHTGDPGTTGANEVPLTNSYGRVASPGFGAPSGSPKQSVNANIVAFAAPTTSNWGTLSWAGVWDAISGGNFLYKILLAFPVATSVGVPVEFEAGTLILIEQ